MTGDGSLQMNLQELQTIIHNHLPIKIFLINNGGYHSIRQTQKTHFHEPLVGIGVDSGDLSFPSMWRSWPGHTAIHTWPPITIPSWERLWNRLWPQTVL